VTTRPFAGISDTSGLSEPEAAARLARDGPNQLVAPSRRGRLKRLLGPLADPMVALLLVAAPTYLLIGETVDAVVALVALVPVAGVGWALERRAERTLERLADLTAPTATVVRGDGPRQVRALDLVVGDVVLLHEGDVIPADGTLLATTEVLVDESSLTGESLPVGKTGSDPHLLAGTTVLTGRVAMRVTATGADTRYGEIGTLLAEASRTTTPLQRHLARLVAVLTVAAAVFCVAVVGAELLRGAGWAAAIIAGVSLAIAAIPEEFSLIYALYLSLGAWHLAREGALVRNLPGVETLGSTTVICTDKTGTLTEGRLDVAALATADGGIRPGGVGAGGEGGAEPGAVGAGGEAGAVDLLAAAVLACEPEPFDPLDLAITSHADRTGLNAGRGRLVVDWPFDPEDKYLSHVWQLADGSYRVAAKGAYEGLLRHASVTPEGRARLDAAHDRFAERAMRVIAVAGAPSDGPTGSREGDEAELEIVGLIAFDDPLRDHVGEALDDCRRAGVRVVLITGDHPVTAHAVAEGLGLPHVHDGRDVIATGDDLDAADPAQLDRLVATANVFARTRPDQKHRIVEALRGRGEVVAMTGDGVNDAPALRSADIGIAMGQRGTPVAREAATMVLLDDNFATIVAATRNGRRIYDNLTRAFAYLIAFHPPLLLAALLVPLLGRPLLLLPVHLVILEVLLHPIVSLVFQAEPADPDVMDRPPRPAGAALSVASLWRPYAIGSTLAVGITGLYLSALELGWPVEEARGLGFTTLLAAQPVLLLIERSPSAPVWRSRLRPTRELAVAVAAVAATAVAVLTLAPLARITQIEPFPAAWWAAVAGVALATTLWAEPLKDPRRAWGRSTPGR
jgi:Ca2+-transporting ATPase